MPTFTVPDGLEYVAAAVVFNGFLQIFQIRNVGKARKVAGIKYPQLYAEAAQAAASPEAYKFNCTQRAHQNTLEYLPIILPSTLVVACKYPIIAASCLGAWTFARFLYTVNYSSGDPAKRNAMGAGIIGAVSSLGVFLTAAYVAVESIFF